MHVVTLRASQGPPSAEHVHDVRDRGRTVGIAALDRLAVLLGNGMATAGCPSWHPHQAALPARGSKR